MVEGGGGWWGKRKSTVWVSCLSVFVERVCGGSGFGGEHKFGWTQAVRWVGV